MGDKDQKKSMVFKTLIVLVILSVLTVMCGLWPLFLLILIGGCIAIIRLPAAFSQNRRTGEDSSIESRNGKNAY